MKPSGRLRLFVLIFFAESLLYFALFAPKLDDVGRMKSLVRPTVRHVLRGTPMPRFKAAPAPVIQAPPPEEFKTVEEHIFAAPAGLKNWEEKIFRGKTLYEPSGEGKDAYLRASSDGSSSGLYLKNLDYPPSRDLYLEWEWRAVKFPKKRNAGKLSNRSEDDFAARIYVVFPGSNFFNSNVLEYIWDESLPEGTLESSPFSGRVKLWVIRSGAPDPAENGGWRVERRNISEDYRKAYGEDQRRNLGAIGFMSDSDNTKTSSEAHFRRMALRRKITTDNGGTE